MSLEPETPEQTIEHLEAMVMDKNSEIVDLTVELGAMKKSMGGWGPVISQAIEMGKDK